MEIAKRMLFPSTCQLKNKTRLFGQCKLTWPLALHHQHCSQCYSFYSQAPANCCSSALNADDCFICPRAEQPSLPSSMVLGGPQQGGLSHLQGFTSHIVFYQSLQSHLPFFLHAAISTQLQSSALLREGSQTKLGPRCLAPRLHARGLRRGAVLRGSRQPARYFYPQTPCRSSLPSSVIWLLLQEELSSDADRAGCKP